MKSWGCDQKTVDPAWIHLSLGSVFLQERGRPERNLGMWWRSWSLMRLWNIHLSTTASTGTAFEAWTCQSEWAWLFSCGYVANTQLCQNWCRMLIHSQNSVNWAVTIFGCFVGKWTSQKAAVIWIRSQQRKLWYSRKTTGSFDDVLAVSLCRLNKFLQYLTEAGFRVSRTHFDPTGIRTDALLVQFKSVLTKYSVPTCTATATQTSVSTEKSVWETALRSLHTPEHEGGNKRSALALVFETKFCTEKLLHVCFYSHKVSCGCGFFFFFNCNQHKCILMNLSSLRTTTW